MFAGGWARSYTEFSVFYLGGRLVFVSGWNWGFGASVDISWDERVPILDMVPSRGSGTPLELRLKEALGGPCYFSFNLIGLGSFTQ